MKGDTALAALSVRGQGWWFGAVSDQEEVCVKRKGVVSRIVAAGGWLRFGLNRRDRTGDKTKETTYEEDTAIGNRWIGRFVAGRMQSVQPGKSRQPAWQRNRNELRRKLFRSGHESPGGSGDDKRDEPPGGRLYARQHELKHREAVMPGAAAGGTGRGRGPPREHDSVGLQRV